MAKVLAHDQERPSASPMATSCFARANRYPPRRPGTRHHPAGQTYWASDDRTRVPLNGNLSAPSAKVGPANSVAPPKVAPQNATFLSAAAPCGGRQECSTRSQLLRATRSSRFRPGGGRGPVYACGALLPSQQAVIAVITGGAAAGKNTSRCVWEPGPLEGDLCFRWGARCWCCWRHGPAPSPIGWDAE